MTCVGVTSLALFVLICRIVEDREADWPRAWMLSGAANRDVRARIAFSTRTEATRAGIIRWIYFSVVNVILAAAPHLRKDHNVGEIFVAPKTKSKSHGTPFCTKAWTLGRGGWRGRDGDCWIFGPWMEHSRNIPKTRARNGEFRGCRGLVAVLRNQGGGGPQPDDTHEVAGGTIVLFPP